MRRLAFLQACPEVPGTGESCAFFWTRELAGTLTAFSNTLGWCFNHASWRYDPDGMPPINNTAAYPRCITTTGDVIPPAGQRTQRRDLLRMHGAAMKKAQPIDRLTLRPAIQLDRLARPR